MPVPKYRTSRSKGRMRRGHEGLAPQARAECPHCHETRLPHRACPSCGHYNGMEIVARSEKPSEERK
jgi:large subunit ribosomal protein L32